MTDTKSHLRGVNDIRTRLTQPGSGSSKAKQANLLARLEHQKALLERQLEVWRKQQFVTERRLTLVRTQIRTATQSLEATRSAPRRGDLPALGAGVATPAEVRHRAIDFTF
jgi:hypothetical protein